MTDTLVTCSHCDGKGWYPEHHPDCRGDCSPGCPIQEGCPVCYGYGEVKSLTNIINTLKEQTGANDVKFLHDDRIAYLYKTITTWRILVEGPPGVDTEEWMLAEIVDGILSFEIWDGYGEPSGAIRHKLGDKTRRRNLLDVEWRYTDD